MVNLKEVLEFIQNADQSEIKAILKMQLRLKAQNKLMMLKYHLE